MDTRHRQDSNFSFPRWEHHSDRLCSVLKLGCSEREFWVGKRLLDACKCLVNLDELMRTDIGWYVKWALVSTIGECPAWLHVELWKPNSRENGLWHGTGDDGGSGDGPEKAYRYKWNYIRGTLAGICAVDIRLASLESIRNRDDRMQKILGLLVTLVWGSGFERCDARNFYLFQKL